MASLGLSKRQPRRLDRWIACSQHAARAGGGRRASGAARSLLGRAACSPGASRTRCVSLASGREYGRPLPIVCQTNGDHKLAARTIRRSGISGADTRDGPGQFLPRRRSGPVVAERTALMLAAVFASVRVLSHTCASVPLLSYRRTAGGRERWMGPPGPLLQNPAPAVTGSSMIATTVAHLAATGDAFLGVFRDQDGIAAQLAPLDPRRSPSKCSAGCPCTSTPTRPADR